MQDLKGKVAVVTGAASGIGNAVATRLAGEGMKVVLADIEQGPLADAEKKLADAGATVLAVPTDVTKAEQVDALAAATFEHFGTAHVVHNNAGVATGGPMWTLTEADWQWVLGVNLWGVIHGVRAFVPRLVEQGEGHVVNTASIAGLTSAPLMGPYNVSKHGVVTLSETLAAELALHGSPVGVSVLCPGWVNTRIHEADRNRPPELQPEAQTDASLLDMGRQMLETLLKSGMEPSDVASKVLDAIRQERFYILTHPEMTPIIHHRMEDILQGRNPAPSFFGA
ncbi:MAG: SDR family NAD(P)-dependent oxidoreductase [Acidimicrobiia bacterium]|nr:SDR family NAD(P)-dependent oxidoreductase [Acidimicrobiia bacterium]